MSKLSRAVVEGNHGRIGCAAKGLFIKRGFHVVSMCDRATGAGSSLGNLCNYYRTKEDILESIIGKYQKVIDVRLRHLRRGGGARGRGLFSPEFKAFAGGQRWFVPKVCSR